MRERPALWSFVNFQRHSIECGIKAVFFFNLQSYGKSSNLLKCFKSYLSVRKQNVMHKNPLSSNKTICAGVPQGSVPGPLLLKLYLR